MRKFLIRFRRVAMFMAIVCACFVCGLMLTGCGAPTWLTDAGNIVATIGMSFTSLSAFIAGLTGNVALAALLTTVSAWISKVQTDIADLSLLISQYQQSPSTGLLATIESSLADVQANVQQDFANLGLPAAVLSVVAGVAGLAEGLLVKWSTAVGAVKSAAFGSKEFHAAVEHMNSVAKSLPQDTAAFKAAVNALFDKKTGDAQVDAALAKTPRI